MNAVVRKLTAEDIPFLNAEGLNGEHLFDYGYYKVSLAEDPSLYCYTRDFGGIAPEDIGPYLRINWSKNFGTTLTIDLAAIYNDPARYPVKTIKVAYVEDVPGENKKIFRSLSEEGV